MAEAAQSRVQSAIKDFINQVDKVVHCLLMVHKLWRVLYNCSSSKILKEGHLVLAPTLPVLGLSKGP